MSENKRIANFIVEFVGRLEQKHLLQEGCDDSMLRHAEKILEEMLEDVDVGYVDLGDEGNLEVSKAEQQSRAVEHLSSTLANVNSWASKIEDESLKKRISRIIKVSESKISDLGKASRITNKITSKLQDIASEVEPSNPEMAKKIRTWMKVIKEGMDLYAAEMGKSPVRPVSLGEDIPLEDEYLSLKIAIDNLKDFVQGKVNDGGDSRFKEFGRAIVHRLDEVSKRLSQGKSQMALPLARSIGNGLRQASASETLTGPELSTITLWLNQFDDTILDKLDRASGSVMS